MPIPNPGERGRPQGCYRCGASPTVMQVGILARPLRKRVSASDSSFLPGATSRSHSYCRDCADAVWDEAFPALVKRETA